MKGKKSNIVIYILLVILAVIFLAPIFIILFNSFKGKLYISDAPFKLPTAETFVGVQNYIDGLSLLGGEPFEPENQEVLVKLLRKVKERYPEKNIWCYSGYLFDEELKKESRARCEYTDEMLSMLDVLVDGRFEEDKKNITLLFRGSENQRLIDVKKSLEQDKVVEWKPAIKRGL